MSSFDIPMQPMGPITIPVDSLFLKITLRDYFAAAVLQGMMATRRADTPRFHPDDDANYCYQVADAMLKERAK